MQASWDLSANAKAWYEYQRDLRIIFPVALVSLVGILIWYGIAVDSRWSWNHTVSILIVAVVVAVLTYLTYMVFQSTAQSMTITKDFIEFHFPSLHAVRYTWKSPSLNFVLKDDRHRVGRGRWGGVNPLFAITLKVPWRPLVCLSTEAFEALERAAEEHGLKLDKSGCVISLHK